MDRALETKSDHELAMAYSRRRHFRVPCNIPITFSAPGMEPKESANLVNLGLGGAKAVFASQLDLGEIINLEFDLDTELYGQTHLAVQAKVAWLMASKSLDGHYDLGLQFLNVQDDQKSILFKIINGVFP